MVEPIVTSINLDLQKLSDEPAFQYGYLSFTFDRDIVAYSVRCMGTNQETGKLIQNGDKYVATQSQFSILEASQMSIREYSSFLAETLISAQIHYTELYQEGENRVNVYGLDMNGNWSNYQTEQPYEPPQEAIIQEIGFDGKTKTDGDKTREIYQLNSSSNQLIPSEYGTTILRQASDSGYSGVSTQNDGTYLELNTSNQYARINFMFAFQLTEIEKIKRLTFQITGSFNEPFRMEYWNVHTQSWDIDTRVNFDGFGDGVLLENTITQITPYSDNGIFRIGIISILSGRLSHDFANLVVEK